MKLSPPVRRAYTTLVPYTWRQWVESRLLPPYPIEYDRHRYIFIHIPKTAGKSIISLLHHRGATHLMYRDYERLIGEAIRDYFVFAVVRDPLERLISAYAYLRQGGNRSRQDLEFARRWVADRSLQRFIVESLPVPEVRESLFFRPQHSFLRENSGRLADATLLRFERLATDFEPIAARLGIRTALPNLNQSSRRDIDATLTASALLALSKCYAEDYTLLGYESPRPLP